MFARKPLERSKLISGKSPPIRRAQFAERKKELQKPLAELGKRIKRNPRDLDACRTRAAYYFELHQYKEAIADYSQIIVFAPDDVKAYLSRAACYQSLEQDDQALEDLAQVIKLSPQNFDAYDAYVARLLIYFEDKDLVAKQEITFEDFLTE